MKKEKTLREIFEIKEKISYGPWLKDFKKLFNDELLNFTPNDLKISSENLKIFITKSKSWLKEYNLKAKGLLAEIKLDENFYFINDNIDMELKSTISNLKENFSKLEREIKKSEPSEEEIKNFDVSDELIIDTIINNSKACVIMPDSVIETRVLKQLSPIEALVYDLPYKDSLEVIRKRKSILEISVLNSSEKEELKWLEFWLNNENNIFRQYDNGKGNKFDFEILAHSNIFKNGPLGIFRSSKEEFKKILKKIKEIELSQFNDFLEELSNTVFQERNTYITEQTINKNYSPVEAYLNISDENKVNFVDKYIAKYGNKYQKIIDNLESYRQNHVIQLLKNVKPEEEKSIIDSHNEYYSNNLQIACKKNSFIGGPILKDIFAYYEKNNYGPWLQHIKTIFSPVELSFRLDLFQEHHLMINKIKFWFNLEINQGISKITDLNFNPNLITSEEQAIRKINIEMNSNLLSLSKLIDSLNHYDDTRIITSEGIYINEDLKPANIFEQVAAINSILKNYTELTKDKFIVKIDNQYFTTDEDPNIFIKNPLILGVFVNPKRNIESILKKIENLELTLFYKLAKKLGEKIKELKIPDIYSIYKLVENTCNQNFTPTKEFKLTSDVNKDAFIKKYCINLKKIIDEYKFEIIDIDLNINIANLLNYYSKHSGKNIQNSTLPEFIDINEYFDKLIFNPPEKLEGGLIVNALQGISYKKIIFNSFLSNTPDLMPEILDDLELLGHKNIEEIYCLL